MFFPSLIQYWHVIFIITVLRGEGGWFVIFRIQLNFIVLFPFLIKYYHIMFIIIVFWLGCDRPSGLLFFATALLFSILTPLVLPPSSVSLSYFILAVPMRKCLGKHSCMSYPFPIAILKVPHFFALWRQWIIGNGALLNKSYYYYLYCPVWLFANFFLTRG